MKIITIEAGAHMREVNEKLGLEFYGNTRFRDDIPSILHSKVTFVVSDHGTIYGIWDFLNTMSLNLYQNVNGALRMQSHTNHSDFDSAMHYIMSRESKLGKMLL